MPVKNIGEKESILMYCLKLLDMYYWNSRFAYV